MKDPVQIQPRGKHDILPEAGQPDLARAPVSLLRATDPNMRLAPRSAATCADRRADERGRLHGAPAIRHPGAEHRRVARSEV